MKAFIIGIWIFVIYVITTLATCIFNEKLALKLATYGMTIISAGIFIFLLCLLIQLTIDIWND